MMGKRTKVTELEFLQEEIARVECKIEEKMAASAEQKNVEEARDLLDKLRKVLANT